MNLKLALVAVLAAIPLAGCNAPQFGSAGNVVSVAASDIANVVKNAPNACAALKSLGGSVASISASVAAANPNNANIQAANLWVQNSGSASNAQCSALAAAFTAQAPSWVRQTKVKIDEKTWSNLVH